MGTEKFVVACVPEGSVQTLTLPAGSVNLNKGSANWKASAVITIVPEVPLWEGFAPISSYTTE